MKGWFTVNLNPLKSVYNFNKEAGLLEAGYSDVRECAFPIEEALEGFESGLGNVTPKEQSRLLMDTLADHFEGTDVDRFDKHLDIIVFSLGSLYKLGLSPQQVMKGLGIVATANLQKLKTEVDAYGKLGKPTDFVPPEEQLQKILDELHN